MLITLCIILIAMLLWLGMMKAEIGVGESTASRVKAKAYGEQCRTYLYQMRMMPLINDPDMRSPTSLSDFAGAGDLRCPVCGMLYGFDPSRAQDGHTYGLYCPYPKHWRY